MKNSLMNMVGGQVDESRVAYEFDRYNINIFNIDRSSKLMKPFLTAVAIAVLLVSGIVYTDYPGKWFKHDMVCDGSIGGGCVCTEESDSLLCNIKNG